MVILSIVFSFNTKLGVTAENPIKFIPDNYYIKYIEMDDDENFDVIMNKDGDWSDYYYAKINTEGLFLNIPFQLIDNHRCSIARDYEGSFHFTHYQRNVSWNNSIIYSKKNSHGATLIEDKVIGISSGIFWQRSLFIKSDNNYNLHLFWMDGRDYDRENIQKNQTGEIYYKKMDFHGNNLTPDIRLTYGKSCKSIGSYYPPNVFSTIDFDSRGNIHLLYRECCYHQKFRDLHSRWNIYYLKLDDDGNILVNSTRVTERNIDTTGEYLKIDSYDNVNIVWTDGRLGDLIDSKDNTDIFFTRLNNSGIWITDIMKISNDDKFFSMNPSFCMDKYRNIHFAWDDTRYYGNNWEKDNIYYSKMLTDGTIIHDNVRIMDVPSSISRTRDPILFSTDDDILMVYEIYHGSPATFHETYIVSLRENNELSNKVVTIPSFEIILVILAVAVVFGKYKLNVLS